jgi:cell wall-associated NlpC family hydrolase
MVAGRSDLRPVPADQIRMGLEGMAAVQARIAEINQMFTTSSTGRARQTPSAKTDFASLLAGASDPAATPAAAATTAPSSTAQQFLQTALAEKGKPYVYGATARTDDPDPKAFDCSELVKWAAERVGAKIPDGATAQYLYTRDHGTTMSVEQALKTPGALLFHFGHEPRDLGDIPADGHVAISLGDGVHTIEARGRKYGTNIFEASGNRAGFFNRAGMIPGM